MKKLTEIQGKEELQTLSLRNVNLTLLKWKQRIKVDRKYYKV